MPVYESQFASETYRARINKAGELAAGFGLGGLIITPGPDFAYLTGSWMSSHERLTALVIPAGANADGCSIIAPATDGFVFAQGPVAAMGMNVLGWSDGDDPYSLVRSCFGDQAAPHFAVASSMTADHLLTLQSVLPGQYVTATDALSQLFTVKDAAELEQLRAAGKAIDAVHAAVPSILAPGKTEREVAQELESRILAEHDVVDFVIVGSGPNGANPHHDFSDRELAVGDVVVVDIGGQLGAGYHSDCTRTYVVGGPSQAEPRVHEVYEVLYEAQAAGRALAAPGVRASAVDAAVRAIITDAGLGQYFTHRTGHGIGLSTHEQPFIIAGNDIELQPGMAFSIEPGIYFPGEWGMRLEDIVVITESGCEALNTVNRKLA